jgi:hypothetical protein
MRNLVRTLPLVAALLAIGCDSPTEPVRLVVPQLTIEAVGDSRQLEATIFGSDVLPEWESLSPELVSVTRAGMVTALASGEARVRARVGTSVAEGKVTVLPAAVVAITSAERQTSSSGAAEIRLRLQNSGGRSSMRARASSRCRRVIASPERVRAAAIRERSDTSSPARRGPDVRLTHPDRRAPEIALCGMFGSSVIRYSRRARWRAAGCGGTGRWPAPGAARSIQRPGDITHELEQAVGRPARVRRSPPGAAAAAARAGC